MVTPGDKNSRDGLLLLSEIGQDIADRMPINHGIEDIPHKNRFVPMGNDDLVIPGDGHNQHLEIRKQVPDLSQLPELLATT